MDGEIKELKSILRSLVVSSSVQVDVSSLVRDYRSMMGCPLPIAKFGYKNPVAFLKERCDDCFLFQGSSTNPTLTLIVPATLKHIDKFVQSQKASVHVKYKGKRRSVPESVTKSTDHQQNLIANTFTKSSSVINPNHDKKPEVVAPNIISNHKPVPAQDKKEVISCKNTNGTTVADSKKCVSQSETCSKSAFLNFMKKRTPQYNSTQHLDNDHSIKESDKPSSSTDSGKQASSTSSSTKLAQLEVLKAEIRELIVSHADGVLCPDLIGLYRDRYNRELNFQRFGYTSIAGLVCSVEGVTSSRGPDGELVVRDAAAPVAPGRPGRPHAHYSRSRLALLSSRQQVDVDDALPGIDFDADVFPADCVHFMESIPGARLGDVAPGAMLGVMVAEVYSPSHFWLIRLGDDYNVAMENMMDEMTAYYSEGEGRSRSLSLGAVRVGHYCSSVYEGDWHRSLIVKVVDSDTVKVRHVDYGTVDTVAARALKPLRRAWGSLPAQALRARLAGVRPAALGRRWSRAAAAHLLARVRDRRLAAYLVAADAEEQVAEVLLIDTSTDEDVNIGDEMIKLGHADARPDSALQTSECYLYPRFDALENGDTPNYAEIHGYLRDGIALEFVDAFRRHVPLCLPETLPAPAPVPAPAPAPRELVNRVPLLRPTASPSPATPAPTPPPTPPASPSPPSPPAPPSPAATPAPPPPAAPPAPPPPAPTAPRAPSVRTVPAAHYAKSTPPRVHPAAHTYPAHPGHPMQPGPPHPYMVPPMMPPYPGPPYPPCYPARFGPPPPPPPPPRLLPPRAGVTLSVAECEVYRLLSGVDTGAAHWYMVDAIGRALAGTGVGAGAGVVAGAGYARGVTAGTQTEEPPCAPPPGFEPLNKNKI